MGRKKTDAVVEVVDMKPVSLHIPKELYGRLLKRVGRVMMETGTRVSICGLIRTAVDEYMTRIETAAE